MDKIPLTKTGYRGLEEELRRLKSDDRPNIIRAISEAIKDVLTSLLTLPLRILLSCLNKL